MRVLLIDDSEEMCDIMKELIMEKFEERVDDLEIKMFQRGEEALEIYDEYKPYFCIVDFYFENSSDMQGPAICRKIREKDEDSRIILLTGYTDSHPEVKKMINEKLCCRYVDKSPMMDNITDAILKISGFK